MAKAKKSDIKLEHAIIKSPPKGKYIDLQEMREGLNNVSEMTIIEIMHQKNISREDAINFLFVNSIKP